MRSVVLNGRQEVHTEILSEKLKEKVHLEDVSLDGRIILKLNLKR
jgi:hypothetical protein